MTGPGTDADSIVDCGGEYEVERGEGRGGGEGGKGGG